MNSWTNLCMSERLSSKGESWRKASEKSVVTKGNLTTDGHGLGEWRKWTGKFNAEAQWSKDAEEVGKGWFYRRLIRTHGRDLQNFQLRIRTLPDCGLGELSGKLSCSNVGTWERWRGA